MLGFGARNEKIEDDLIVKVFFLCFMSVQLTVSRAKQQ